MTTLIADDKAGEAVEVMRGEWLQVHTLTTHHTPHTHPVPTLTTHYTPHTHPVPTLTTHTHRLIRAVVAKQLLDNKHPALALEVCSLTSDPSHPLLCVQLECLGSLRQVEGMQQLLEEVVCKIKNNNSLIYILLYSLLVLRVIRCKWPLLMACHWLASTTEQWSISLVSSEGH